ncbi:MAG TPA: nucleoside-diphosphate kinase [Perlabentimonas sp.]|jgi:nucleoside-diphosphate kinase|nr:nucleoside-diphosphate kinase [Bacteroidales bacterium]MDD4671704.1 nucleoside-diphosphate kinase [Bacteroidales bacterium]MDY0348377.1 nucleoside-diphosphate kinase [Tenuifilaceae bacterium]HZJ74064.1 nucleoside-diphosphate kinase [Perlabentimonas sp.]
MDTNRTFALIKPDAVRNNYHGEIILRIIQAGFTLKAMRMVKLSKFDAERFYAVHKGKEFFDRLTTFISSGPVVALVLEKSNAVADYRALIGSTNPHDAAEGTIRNLFGETITQNAVHGADSDENAQKEWSFFFAQKDILD